MPDPITGTMAAVSIGSGIMQSNAARDAARMQSDSASRAMDQERAMYEQSRQDLAPYRETGYTALRDIERMKPYFTSRFGQPYQAGQTRSLTAPQYAAPPPRPAIGIVSPGGPGGVGTTYNPSGQLPPNYQEARDAFQRQLDAQRASDPLGAGNIRSAVIGSDQFGQQFGYAADADAFDQFYNQNYGAPASDMAADGTQMMPISGPGSPFEEYLDPSMAFRQRLGTQATERLANVGGGAISGNTMRALTDYGQNLASTEYGNAFNRFQTERGNIYNTLANIAGMGQGAVNTGVNAGQSFAGQQTGLITGQAAANAAGAVGSANALAGGFGGASNAYLLNQLMRPQAVAQSQPMGGPQSSQIYNPVALA
jgi:hypothetical protein